MYARSMQVRTLDSSPPDGPLVNFGPEMPNPADQQQIPKTFERAVSNEDLGLELIVSCAFDGDKIVLRQLTVAGNEVTPRDLTRLGLPWVIRHIAGDVIPKSYRWEVFIEAVATMDTTRTGGPTDETLLKIAQYYWYDHITWFKPRANIMQRWEVSRTTANEWIRKAAKLYPMPGRPLAAPNG